MKTQWWLIAILAASIFPVVPASGDVTIRMKVNGEPSSIAVEPHKLRFEGSWEGMIFRGDKQVLWVLDAGGKSYAEMTRQEMEQTGRQMDEAMSQMQEAMKDMPPEQRAAVEAMMKGRQAPKKPSKTVKATGESKTVNGFACKGYTVTDEYGVSEIWAAEPRAFELSAADLAPFREFADFMQTMLPGMDRMSGFIKDFEHPGEGEVPGIPVHAVRKNLEGGVVVTTEIVSVDRGDVPASSFEVPAGFKKDPGLGRPGAADQPGGE